MKQYKVIHVSDNRVSDSERYWRIDNCGTRQGQEMVLNYYGARGWRLVSVASNDNIGSSYETTYLYLERDV